MAGLGLQEPIPPIKPAAGEGATGRFSVGKIFSIDRAAMRRKLVPWVMKGGLAILDQGVFAGSNVAQTLLSVPGGEAAHLPLTRQEGTDNRGLCHINYPHDP